MKNPLCLALVALAGPAPAGNGPYLIQDLCPSGSSNPEQLRPRRRHASGRRDHDLRALVSPSNTHPDPRGNDMFRTLLTASCLSLAVPLGWLALGPTGQGSPPSFDTLVINGPSDPVPVARAGEPVWIRFQGQDDTFSGFSQLLMTSGSACTGFSPSCAFTGSEFAVPAGYTLYVDSVSVWGRVVQGTVPPTMSALLSVGDPILMTIHLGAADRTEDNGFFVVWTKTYTTSLAVPGGAKLQAALMWSAYGPTYVDGNMTLLARLVPVP